LINKCFVTQNKLHSSTRLKNAKCVSSILDSFLTKKSRIKLCTHKAVFKSTNQDKILIFFNYYISEHLYDDFYEV